MEEETKQIFVRRPGVSQTVLQALVDHRDEPYFTAEGIAAMLPQFQRKQINNALWGLRRSGVLVQLGRGIYKWGMELPANARISVEVSSLGSGTVGLKVEEPEPTFEVPRVRPSNNLDEEVAAIAELLFPSGIPITHIPAIGRWMDDTIHLIKQVRGD